MVSTFGIVLGLLFVGILFGLLAMVLINVFTVKRLEKRNICPISSKPVTLSVLIPARNEAQNLTRLLPALLQSSRKPDEILVLDDESSDSTYDLASKILQCGDIPFQVIVGRQLSSRSGLSGKNHACAQLAQAASGDALLFCDADVMPSTEAISRTIHWLKSIDCAGISGLPRQITIGYRERLVIPWIMQLPLLTLLPLGFGWKTQFRSLQMANGQWLAIWRERYEEVGGHQALGLDLVDDMRLARLLVKRERPGILPLLSVSDLSVQMYGGWEEMIQGFSKNIVQIYGGNSILFSIGLLSWIGIFSFPLWGFYFNPVAAAVGFVLIIAIRCLSAWIFSAPAKDVVYHMQSLIFLLRLGLSAIWNQYFDRVQWKDRRASF